MKRFVIVMLLGLCFVQYLIQPHAYAAQMFSDRQTQGQADMRRTLDGESRMVLDAISDGVFRGFYGRQNSSSAVQLPRPLRR